MKYTAMRLFVPLVLVLALLLAACGGEDAAATRPTGESDPTQTEQATTAETGTEQATAAETGTEPVYTEPEAPVVTFPAEPVTEPAEDPTQDTAAETAPQEEVPQETYSGDPSGDENELPAIPF